MQFKGYHQDRRGSTHVMFKNSKGKTVPVPKKPGTMAQGTVSKILKQMSSNREELAAFLYD